MLTLNVSTRHSGSAHLRSFHHIRSLFSAQTRQDVASANDLKPLHLSCQLSKKDTVKVM